MEKVLGFDISSTTIGWGLLTIDGEEIKYSKSGFIKPSKKGTIVDRIYDTREQVVKIMQDCKPDYVGIEDIVQFMQGKSTAKTIITLTTFNRMVCLAARDELQKSPELYSVMSIRHGIKKTKVLPKKEEIPDLVASHLGVTFPYKLNRKGAIKVENYDEADGLAVALYYSFVLTGRVKPKKRK